VEKGDLATPGALADSGRERLEAGPFGPRQRRRQVVHDETHVVHPGAASREVAGDRGVVPRRLQELDPAGSVSEEGDPDALAGNLLLPGRVLSEERRPKGDGLVEGIDRDSDVVDLVQARSLPRREGVAGTGPGAAGPGANVGRTTAKDQHEIRETAVATAQITEITDANFETEIGASDGLAIVDFWAEWCGPCRMVGPIIEELAQEYAGRVKVGKLDVDRNPKVAGRFSIRSIPSILYFKDGELVDLVVGAYPKKYLEEKIQEHV
jgi:thioredoxin 1